MMQYQLLDSGNKQKLEQVGKYRLVRPALNAFWERSLPDSDWQDVHGVFERNSTGGGEWRWFNGGVPESWVVKWASMKLLVRPTGFGHLGFFAEQYCNWQWQQDVIRSFGNGAEVLNLFAYSGVGSMAMAEAGAKVCHLDAARGMVEWGKENLALNSQTAGDIRWIVDDVMKFINREVRRGNRYNGIVLDPPSFGRGPKGQIWKMEEGIGHLLSICGQIVDTARPYFVLLSCHSPGFSPIVLERLLGDNFSRNADISSGEMTIPEKGGRLLSAGIYARLLCNSAS